MDKLYFYICKTDTMVAECVAVIDSGESAAQFLATSMRIDSYLRSSSRAEQAAATFDGDDDVEESLNIDSVTMNQSSQADSDSSSSSEEDDDDAEVSTTVGKYLLQAWTLRRGKLVSDYAITAWMLSPVPEIMADAGTNHTGDDRDAVNRLLVKLLVSPCGTDAATEQAKGETMNTFWDEFEKFHAKSGPYANKPHIWNSNDLTTNQSHIWHKKNS